MSAQIAPNRASALDVLSSSWLSVVFAFEPTGLGHLRVTRALYDSLPPGVSSALLGSDAQALSALHRISSLNPAARAVFEWFQRGKPENVFTTVYRGSIRRMARLTFHQMATLLEQRVERPTAVLAIATHFGLAHQLAAIKPRLLKERGVRMVLVVQVTDDSPAHIWHVRGADLTLVPSHRTRLGLLDYARRQGEPEPAIEVLPYPVCPRFAAPLDARSRALRDAQLDPRTAEPIHVAIPVSGAAVGLPFSERLMDALRAHSPRYRFHVVARRTPYTRPFLERAGRCQDVEERSSRSDRDVVRLYEELYAEHVIGLEVTKPSEQAFKALCGPDLRGGSVLLLAPPVGRQEHDNLAFLRRHRLMPPIHESRLLWARAASMEHRDPENGSAAARSWRALELPPDPEAAARFIEWVRLEGVLFDMRACRVAQRPGDPNADELAPDGARRFWSRVARLLSNEEEARPPPRLA